jgi:hypothetical protein
VGEGTLQQRLVGFSQWLAVVGDLDVEVYARPGPGIVARRALGEGVGRRIGFRRHAGEGQDAPRYRLDAPERCIVTGYDIDASSGERTVRQPRGAAFCSISDASLSSGLVTVRTVLVATRV